MAIPTPPYWAYRIFKYIVYLLLISNIYFFFAEERAATTEVFASGVTWRNLYEAYSATLDTLAWVILLLLFELETSTIPDDRLQGSLKWWLAGLRSLCFVIIALAFFGYCSKYNLLSSVAPFSTADICNLSEAGFSYLASLNNYAPIDSTSCINFRGEILQRITGTQVLATPETLASVTRLAIVDIVNSATWLVVVAVLELEIFLQLAHHLSQRLLQLSTYAKVMLYSVLLFCAMYWGLLGDLLDFWDAFLWLVAFVFIEMNMLEWHQETHQPTGSTAQ
jgi:hypothetical protein